MRGHLFTAVVLMEYDRSHSSVFARQCIVSALTTILSDPRTLFVWSRISNVIVWLEGKRVMVVAILTEQVVPLGVLEQSSAFVMRETTSVPAYAK